MPKRDSMPPAQAAMARLGHKQTAAVYALPGHSASSPHVPCRKGLDVERIAADERRATIVEHFDAARASMKLTGSRTVPSSDQDHHEAKRVLCGPGRAIAQTRIDAECLRTRHATGRARTASELGDIVTGTEALSTVSLHAATIHHELLPQPLSSTSLHTPHLEECRSLRPSLHPIAGEIVVTCAIVIRSPVTSRPPSDQEVGEGVR